MKNNRNVASRRRRSKGSSASVKVRGTGFLTNPSNSSNLGLVVVDRYEIDTSLCQTFTTHATLYEKWKINSLRFELVPISVNSVAGTNGIAILEDTDDTSPTTIDNFISLRRSIMARQAKESALTLEYRPKHVPWLFTKDGGLSDDRFEMPGDLLVMSADYTTAGVQFRVLVHYDVDFDLVSNTSVSYLMPPLDTIQERKEFLASFKDRKKQVLMITDKLVANSAVGYEATEESSDKLFESFKEEEKQHILDLRKQIETLKLSLGKIR